MTTCFLFVRSWKGFTDSFPHFGELSALHQTHVHRKLDERTREILKSDDGRSRIRASVKEHGVKAQRRQNETLRLRAKHATTRPRGSTSLLGTRRRILRSVELQKTLTREPVWWRIARHLGWVKYLSAYNDTCCPGKLLWFNTAFSPDAAETLRITIEHTNRLRLSEDVCSDWIPDLQPRLGFVAACDVDEGDRASIFAEIGYASKKPDGGSIDDFLRHHFCVLAQEVRSSLPGEVDSDADSDGDAPQLNDHGPPASSTAASPAVPRAERGDDRQLQPAVARAYGQYLTAKKNKPELKTDLAVYEHYRENHFDRENEDAMPSFETWAKQVRIARKFHGTQKNTRRAGRTGGSSIVTPERI